MDTDLDRPRWRSTATYRVLPTLQVGVEYNPAAGDLAPLASWFLLAETEARPAVFLGTSSDRIGSPEGEQAYYLTVAKYLPWARLAPYASVSYSEWEDRIRFPAGVGLELGRGLYLRHMYDGVRSHLVGGAVLGRFDVAALWIWYERAGVSVAVGF